MKTTYEQIVEVTKIGQHGNVDLNSIFSMAEQERFPAAVNDSPKRLLLAIDVQKDFMQAYKPADFDENDLNDPRHDLIKDGSLAVPGSIGDVERITRFIYNNMGGISRITCSLDTHIAHQIFHPCWWTNSEGDHPTPYTVITYDDVVNNRWRPVIGELPDSIQYLKELEKVGAGKKQLCIWPYHCISGTDGGTLENQFAKMVYFHSVARKSVNRMIQKGTDPYSEMYGIIKPEYSKKNFLNTPVLTDIEKYDEIYVVGEAASHCLMESVKQIAEHFANRPEVTQKITILEDCTSPITGFEADTDAAFTNFKNSYGIKFAKSTDIQF